MGKSQETFSKKEKEKKKLAKRQEKKEKKEERQANARNGNNLEHMLAYLDENGNIISTPPDPRKRKVVNVEDIQIGVAKQEPVDEADLIRTGVVTMFNESKGYGFIKDSKSSDSLFVHINSLVDRIKEGDKVIFEVDGIIYPLTIPSGSESGLKIKVSKKLQATIETILIDFDADLSVKKENDGYKLRPVIRLK